MSLFVFGNNFYKNKETFKIFSPQILEVYRNLLVETTLESNFTIFFSVIKTLFVPCTALLYDSTAATGTLKLLTILLSISCWVHLISLLMMSSLVSGFFSQAVFQLPLQNISRTEHLNISGITSHGTDTFHVKLITPGHSIPKISTHLTMFWRGNWKTEFVKTSQRQERTSSKKRSGRFRKKCSIESWTTLMFKLLLCCHTAIQCMEQT